MKTGTNSAFQSSSQGIFFKLATVTLLTCFTGCSGGGDEVKLAPVSGMVTMDGKPLADVVVIFSPEKGNPSSGRTDSDGKYSLIFKENAKGAIPGMHKVSIITGGPVSSQNSDDDGGISQTLPIDTFPGENDGVAAIKNPKGTFKKDPIPDRYNTKSELKKEVVDGKNSFDFELTSK